MTDTERQSTSDGLDIGETKGITEMSKVTRKILMPVDGSEHSERAFNWYMDNVMKTTDGLYLVHIVEPLSPGLNYNLASKSPSIKEDFSKHINSLVESGRALREKFFTRCEENGLTARFTIHVGTKPGENIVRLANENEVNLVIIGNRGIGTVKRTFLGSVSDHVLHNVNVPVIVIPPPKHPKKK
ncbi:hypothetical protein MN116_001664 [Schistosoma mekongi]|uniref:UspA domain-containing protein n=1 Tax=Schistosoma mekongi TaxID=38744 RepID=A0AAE1ZJJ7_SCHME|nr:hypothetical protein MN116_001664 [Schistosoma mekongi]